MAQTRTPHADVDRLIVWPVLAASAAMFLWMARPLLTGEVPFTGDLLHFHYPLRDFYSQALSNGLRFDWMPSLFSGFYVVGEGQLGAYHPLHWLLYRLLPLDVAFDIEIVAAYPFMFAGMWLFLRQRVLSAPAVFGAMLFTFCGFNLSHGVHVNMVTVVAHIPWLLWAIDAAFSATDRWSRIGSCAAIGVLTGSQLLVGHPQAMWLSQLTAVAFTLLLFVGAPRQARRSGLGMVAAGTLLGLAIGAVQLLATLDAARHSVRLAVDPAFASTFSLPPTQLVQVIQPYLFWGRVLRWNEVPTAMDEFAVYGGAVGLVLALWWLALYPSLRSKGLSTASDRLGLCAAAFGLVGLWLATGHAGRLYDLQAWLPWVGLFRAPVRFVPFTQLALAVVGAIALNRLTQQSAVGERGRWQALWAPWSVAAASGLAAVMLGPGDGQGGGLEYSVRAAVVGPAVLAAAAGLLTLATRGARWAVVGLVLLAAGDQALYGLGGTVTWQDFLTRQDVVELLGPDESRPPTGPDRLVHGGFPNLYTLGGYRLLGGYLGLIPAKQLDYRSPNALRVAQVGYEHRGFEQVARVPGAEPLGSDWFQIPAPVARARLLTEARVSTKPAVDLEMIDVELEALVTQGLSLDGGLAGTAAVVKDEPGDIRVETNTSGRQILVISESFDEGWVASIDGLPAPVEQVNGDFLGCVVPAGIHEVVLQFRPPHLVVGKTISVAAVVFTVLLLVGSRRNVV